MTYEDAAVVVHTQEKSILEQILDEMSARLADHSDISPETLGRVQQLAKSNQLKRPEKVVEAIKSTTRGNHEADRA